MVLNYGGYNWHRDVIAFLQPVKSFFLSWTVNRAMCCYAMLYGVRISLISKRGEIK